MHQLSFNDVQLMEYARMAPSRTAFIDESGNFGFDFSLAGTSKFYVICAIIVETAYLQSLQERVIEAKRTVGFAESEMKSSIIGSNRGRRVRLLQELLNVDFQAVVLVANKQKLIEGSPLREYKKSFIKYLNQKLYTMLYQVYPKLQIVADEQGNSEFQSSFQSYVENNRPLPNLLNEFDFGFCDSKADVLIQVADIIGLPPVFVPTSELVKTVSWHPHSFIGLATS